jgi:hypothetical protein
MTKSNSVRKWSYKTNSPKFQKLFMEAGNAVDTVMNWKEASFAMDIGATTFVVTYADKTKRERNFFLPGGSIFQRVLCDYKADGAGM